MRLRFGMWLFSTLVLILSGCVREQPQIIIITATFPGDTTVDDPVSTETPAAIVLSPVLQQSLSNPTPNTPVEVTLIQTEHIVQPGDTLFLIAQRYGTTIDNLISLNELANPDVLQVGQVLLLPQTSGEYTPNFKIFPDSRIIRGPYSSLDIAEFISRQPGYIRNVQGVVEIRQDNGIPVPRTVSIAEVIEQVSVEYSVDPRLLLMLLEFRAQWLSNPQPLDDLLSRPIVSASIAPLSEGIYYQLAWAANQLNQGYYGWKSRGSNILGLPDGRRVAFHPELNPGTIALQYLFSLGVSQQDWEFAISPNGFYRLYTQYFGDPFAGSVDQVVDESLVQPPLLLPFESGVMWRLTGGPHGGWGSGSAWSSIDFAPAQENTSGLYCYVADDWITAVANGLIVRSRDGAIVLDLDGDGNESTGWTILYLHMNISEAVRAGETVVAGQRIGKPSCAGGISSATHLHIARKFNGEWIPADCSACMPGYRTPDFEMSGWIVEGIENQEYQGYMSRSGITVQAEQGWTTTINIIRGE